MEDLFAKPGALLDASLARLKLICRTYKGSRRVEEFEKVYQELREWYERADSRCGDWQLAFYEAKDLVAEKKVKIRTQEATIETLRAELAVAHNRLADIAEHYDMEHESDIPALGFLNLKEKA